MLRTTGRLLIGNFTPSAKDVGYMEVYMGWYLLYRDDRDIRHLARPIPISEMADIEIVRDSTGAVIYLDLRRK